MNYLTRVLIACLPLATALSSFAADIQLSHSLTDESSLN